MGNVVRTAPLGAIGARIMVDAVATGGRVTLIEITLPSRELVAPLHRHSREDEYTVVLAGRIGAMLGEKVVHAEPGDLIYKPRDQWHTFWNAGDEPARVIEIICPAGFERFIDEFALNAEAPTPEASVAVGARYGLVFDFGSAPG